MFGPSLASVMGGAEHPRPDHLFVSYHTLRSSHLTLMFTISILTLKQNEQVCISCDAISFLRTPRTISVGENQSINWCHFTLVFSSTTDFSGRISSPASFNLEFPNDPVPFQRSSNTLICLLVHTMSMGGLWSIKISSSCGFRSPHKGPHRGSQHRC
jgi:hypothetical protein